MKILVTAQNILTLSRHYLYTAFLRRSALLVESRGSQLPCRTLLLRMFRLVQSSVRPQILTGGSTESCLRCEGPREVT